MKKNIKYFSLLLLSLVVIGGAFKAFAAVPEPTNKLNPGDTFNMTDDVVTYRVVGWNGNLKTKDADNKDVEIGAYEVKIAGVDYDYVETTPSELTINTVFQWKRGKDLVNFYVTGIDGTNDVEKGAFWAQTNLTKVTIQNTLKYADTDNLLISNDQFDFTVGENAFNGSSNLKTLTLPSNTLSIGEYAFRSTAIEEFEIPAGTQTIGQFAFDNTRKLNKVTVAAGEKDKNGEDLGNTKLQTISQKVFANSTVKELDLSNARALTTIQDDAFIYAESAVNNQLQLVKLPNAWLDTEDGKLVVKDKGKKSIFSSLGTKGVAFENCTALKKIENTEISVIPTIAAGTSATSSAFYNCESLEELYLPVTASIEGPAAGKASPFYGCKALKKLRFADGWNQIIGDDIYQNTFLTDEEEEVQKSYLEAVVFEGVINGGGIIGTSAFQDCANLATLTFTKGIDATGGNVNIFSRAFEGTALENVDFKAIAAKDHGVYVGPNAFNCDDLETVKFGTVGANGDAADSYFQVAPNAFISDALESVEFGDITLTSKDGTYSGQFTLSNGSFQSDVLKKVTFAKITGNDPTSAIATIGSGDRVFTVKNPVDAPDALEEVTIGDVTAGNFTIGEKAFESLALKTVKINKITTPSEKINGNLTIGNKAFGIEPTSPFDPAGCNEKTVTIGDIIAQEKDGNKATLTVSFGNYAFAGDLLKAVKIGSIRGENAKVKFYSYSFANTTKNEKKFTAMLETVEIGELAAAGLDIDTYTFTAPQKKDSEFEVTIGAEDKDKNFKGITVDPKAISAKAFYAPQNIGTASYTIGDIDATANIAGGAFEGSCADEAKKVPATSVEVGKYNKSFPNQYTFSNVYDLTIAEWNPTSYNDVTRIAVPVTLFVEGDVNTSMNGDYSSGKIESIEIGGDVADGVKFLKFGESVRKIDFSGEDPVIAKNCIADASFKLAADAAKTAGEQIVVVYKTQTPAKSNAIIVKTAFNTTNDAEVVVLYTDEWTKVNIFQNKSIYDELPYRMTLSASSIVPGEDIVSKCYVQNGGKYAYGRLYIPAGAGMYYKINAKKGSDGKNAVTVYSANNDGTTKDIYMIPVSPIDGWYYIDATEANQTLIVRTSAIDDAQTESSYKFVEVEAVAADADDIAMIAADDDLYWFDKTDANKNALRFATEEVVNQELQNNAEFKNQSIYVMANPVKNGLAFALLNQYTTSRNLAKNSIYVVVKKLAPAKAARDMNVIWVNEDGEIEGDATAIETIETINENSGAIYNLQGVRVKDAKKGLYIKNGKKFLVK